MNARFTPTAASAIQPVPKSFKPAKDEPKKPSKVETLLVLEAQVRETSTLAELQFLIANETKKIIACRQILVHRGNPKKAGWRIEKVSSVVQVDRNTPLLKWLHFQIKLAVKNKKKDEAANVDLSFDASTLKENYPFKKGIYLPFKDRHGNELGGMSLLAEKEISPQDLAIAQRLAQTYAHAWSALKPASKAGWYLFSKRNGLIAAILLAVIGCIPVPLTVLAPLEVAARDALIIAAPIEGVIEEVLVSPNVEVKKGDLLFRYNALDLKNRDDLATRNMAVASARYQRASQSSFGGGDGRRELAITKAEYDVAVEEKRYAAEQLARVDVRAQANGIVLFSSKDDWVGRPVAIGERIMRLADVRKTEIRIKVPVGDSIILSHDTTAKIFLDSDPLHSMPAIITRKSYSAEKDGDAPMAFPVNARLKDEDKETGLRIGLRGTAQLSGETVPLAFNLFRKPLSAIRQYLGL